MKRTDVQVGGIYAATVSGKLVRVKMLRDRGKCERWGSGCIVERHHGWDALNLDTKRVIHVRTAARLRPLPPTRREILNALTRAEAEEGIYDLGADDAETHAG